MPSMMRMFRCWRGVVPPVFNDRILMCIPKTAILPGQDSHRARPRDLRPLALGNTSHKLIMLLLNQSRSRRRLFTPPSEGLFEGAASSPASRSSMRRSPATFTTRTLSRQLSYWTSWLRFPAQNGNTLRGRSMLRALRLRLLLHCFPSAGPRGSRSMSVVRLAGVACM